eukprot:GAHX01000379.1.p1 GENE.GAHX01000379.1~~GAHX01000379.1.p1  ORF type:complete len:282 (-),score=51.49 GAHX01000379.1:37-882(-)
MEPVSCNLSSNHLVIYKGIQKAEINDLLSKFIGSGYDSVEISYPTADTLVLSIITGDRDYLSENNGLRLNEIETMVALRYGYEPMNVKANIDEIENGDISARFQAEVLASKIASGIAPRRAIYGVLRSSIRAGARGAEVRVSGKSRGARAKTMKFRTGFIIRSGDAVRKFVRSAIKSVNLKQGVIGIKVTFMMPGPKDGSDLPDRILMHEDREKQRLNYEKRQERMNRDRAGEPNSGMEKSADDLNKVMDEKFKDEKTDLNQGQGIKIEEVEINGEEQPGA